MRETIVIGGSLAQKPGVGGHTWALLQYPLGFRDLGYDVLFIDHLDSAQCRVATGGPSASAAESINVQYVSAALGRFGLDGHYALIIDNGREWLGVSREQALDTISRAPLFLNIMGFVRQAEVMAAARRRVFLDIDPGFGQMWTELGLSRPFADHHAYVTIGERIGEPDCEVPRCGLDWITTPQPVVLAEWPRATAPADRITTVASWRGAYGPIDYGGKRYGLRVHEFRKFADVPRRCGGAFEIALDIHPADAADRERLTGGGWSVVSPADVAATPDAYRAYLQNSAAEFMVAKNMYVETRSGWLSDRSLCYLASGRPVLAEDTGWTALYPAGEGLVPFTTADEAAAAVDAVRRDYARHAAAARQMAAEHFDSRRVLTRLMARLAA